MFNWRDAEKTSQNITDEYEAMYPESDITIENFEVLCEVEIDLENVFCELTVNIIDGKLSEVIEVIRLMLLNRSGDPIVEWTDDSERAQKVYRYLVYNLKNFEEEIIKEAWRYYCL